jgi:hypothetical protein
MTPLEEAIDALTDAMKQEERYCTSGYPHDHALLRKLQAAVKRLEPLIGSDGPDFTQVELDRMERMSDLEDLREAGEALVTKLEECKAAIESAFTMAWIHGARYDGPNYKAELEALKAAVIETGGKNEHQG